MLSEGVWLGHVTTYVLHVPTQWGVAWSCDYPFDSPMCNVPHPSEGGVARFPLLKHPQEPDVQARTYEHGDLKVQTDLVQLLLHSSAHFRESELQRGKIDMATKVHFVSQISKL